MIGIFGLHIITKYFVFAFLHKLFWPRRESQLGIIGGTRPPFRQLVKRQEGQKGRRNNASVPCNDIMAGFNWLFVHCAPHPVQ